MGHEFQFAAIANGPLRYRQPSFGLERRVTQKGRLRNLDGPSVYSRSWRQAGGKHRLRTTGIRIRSLAEGGILGRAGNVEISDREVMSMT